MNVILLADVDIYPYPLPVYHGGMNIVLDVHGMSCGHCVKSITAAVTPLAGVTAVDVDLSAKKVTVTGNADPRVVAAAIEDCGYDVSSTVSA